MELIMKYGKFLHDWQSAALKIWALGLTHVYERRADQEIKTTKKSFSFN